MRTLYSAKRIRREYEANLDLASSALATLPVYSGTVPAIRGLSGWVFEQVVLHAIRRELGARKSSPHLEEQVSIGGRAKVDLQIGRAWVEIKLSGSYDSEGFMKYAKYRLVARKRGFKYLYLCGEETYAPNRIAARAVFGRANTFFLDPADDWPRFVERIVDLCSE